MQKIHIIYNFAEKRLKKLRVRFILKDTGNGSARPFGAAGGKGCYPPPPCICDTDTYTVALLRRTPIIRRFALQRKVLIKPPYQWRQCRTYYFCCVCKDHTQHFSFPGGNTARANALKLWRWSLRERNIDSKALPKRGSSLLDTEPLDHAVR